MRDVATCLITLAAIAAWTVLACGCTTAWDCALSCNQGGGRMESLGNGECRCISNQNAPIFVTAQPDGGK